MNYHDYILGWPNHVLVDKYQDIEVEFDSSGTTATGFVVAGLSNIKDTTTLGCSATTAGYCGAWNGMALKGRVQKKSSERIMLKDPPV